MKFLKTLSLCLLMAGFSITLGCAESAAKPNEQAKNDNKETKKPETGKKEEKPAPNAEGNKEGKTQKVSVTDPKTPKKAETPTKKTESGKTPAKTPKNSGSSATKKKDPFAQKDSFDDF